jgi:serine/threonine protein kinase/TolB-like protein
MVGHTLSHYKVLEEISRGGMGIVYRALDLKLDREVALKVLLPELVAAPERKRRFVQEAKAAAKLNHPHIGIVFEIDETDGVTFIAMELIEGEKLKDIIVTEELGLTRALELATEIAGGMARAHDKGIVHRDLKPANIMVTEDGHAKIIDFGLAKLAEPLVGECREMETLVRGETEPGRVMGTVSYMSPEQASGQKLDHRSDIFSFGIVLHEMLTGQHPFQGTTEIDTLHAILRNPAPRLAEMNATLSSEDTPHLQRFLDKCLARNPDDRYQSNGDLLEDLKVVLEDVPASERRAQAPTSLKSRRMWAAALGIAVVGIVLGWFLLGRDRTPPGIGASGRPAITVMYFESMSGDEEIRWLSKGLPNMLLTDLAQIPGLDVVSSERIHEALKQIGHDDLESIDKSVVAEVSRRAGAGAVVVGSIFKSCAEVRIDVQVEGQAGRPRCSSWRTWVPG